MGLAPGPDKKTEKVPLKVAILMKDSEEAAKIFSVFKKIRISPQIFTSFKKFWNYSIEQIPALSVVDVRLIGDEDLALKDHPYIKTEQMPLIFYYENQTIPLLHSTYDIFHFGQIRKEATYSGQIKTILKRFNKYRSIEKIVRDKKFENKRLDSKVSGIIQNAQTVKQKESFFNNLKEMVADFERNKTCEDLFQCLSKVFLNRDEIKTFSIYETSKNKQKLISPEVGNLKFKPFPSLWLGQPTEDGIEFFAQNMAIQVAIDLLGGEVVTLLIRGNGSNPERLVFLELNDEEIFSNFDWTFLEVYLAGLNSFYNYRSNKGEEGHNSIISPWRFFDLLEERLFKDTDESLSVVDIDFSHLVNLGIANSSNKFHWSEFIRNFINKFEATFSHEFKVTSFGISNVGFLISADQGGKLFDELKKFSTRFPYWRFFNDSDAILNKKTYPQIKMVPSSPFAYMKHLEEVKQVKQDQKGLDRNDIPLPTRI